MTFPRHPRYTSEQPIGDRGDGAVLAIAVLVLVVVLLALNVVL